MSESFAIKFEKKRGIIIEATTKLPAEFYDKIACCQCIQSQINLKKDFQKTRKMFMDVAHAK